MGRSAELVDKTVLILTKQGMRKDQPFEAVPNAPNRSIDCGNEMLGTQRNDRSNNGPMAIRGGGRSTSKGKIQRKEKTPSRRTPGEKEHKADKKEMREKKEKTKKRSEKVQ